MSKHRGKNKISLYNKTNQQLNNLFTPGISKIDADKNSIRSYQTLETYKQIGKRFAQYCTEEHCTSFEDMKNYISEFLYLHTKENKSIATLKTERSALSKIFDISSFEIMNEIEKIYYKNNKKDLNKDWTLKRSYIKRSRTCYNDFINDSKGVALDVKNLCIASGLRRRELLSLCPCHIRKDESGLYYLLLTANKNTAEKYGTSIVKCKGGRDRIIHMINDPEALEVLEKYSKNKNYLEPIFNNVKISKNQDIHNYRAIFANRIYEMNAKPIKSIDINNRIKSQRPNKSTDNLVSPIIYLRNDLRGFCLDREAVRIVSKELGHNREEIYGASYFRKDLISNIDLVKK